MKSSYWTMPADALFRAWAEKRRRTDPLHKQAVRPMLLGDLVRDLQRMDRLLKRKGH